MFLIGSLKHLASFKVALEVFFKKKWGFMIFIAVIWNWLFWSMAGNVLNSLQKKIKRKIALGDEN